MTRTRVGFVGAGGIASRHLGNLLTFPDVSVVAVADPDPARAGAQAARCAGRVYAAFEELLDRERLDALYICVPPFAHGPPELAAAVRGLPFFVEKPLAADLETAERIAGEVEARRLVTGTGYHWRYLDIVERAQELVRANPARLALGYWLDFTPPPMWWQKDGLSGGQMIEQTTHIFDLARLLVGDVTRLSAAGARAPRAAFPDLDVDEISVAMLQFESGALGTVASTCILNWPHRIGLHLFSEGMAIELSEWEIMVDVGEGRPVQRAAGDPFVREDRDFIDAVRGLRNCIRAPYHEALRSHRLAWAARCAAHNGSMVDLTVEVPRG